MPKFKDTRKNNRVPFFNGWTDELEPKSPIADLFGKLVPLMSTMKKKGAFHFPPNPPHQELPTPPTSVVITRELDGQSRGAINGCNINYTNDTINTCLTTNNGVDWERPELRNYGCEMRTLVTVNSSLIRKLASGCHYKLPEDELSENSNNTQNDSSSSSTEVSQQKASAELKEKRRKAKRRE
jgi:hypothetical protein